MLSADFGHLQVKKMRYEMDLGNLEIKYWGNILLQIRITKQKLF